MSKLDQMLNQILSKLEETTSTTKTPEFPLFLRKQTPQGQTILVILTEELFKENHAHVLVDTLTEGDFGDLATTSGNPLRDSSWEQISESEALSNISKSDLMDFLGQSNSSEPTSEDPEIDWNSPDPKYTVSFDHQTGEYVVGKTTYQQIVGAEYTTNLTVAKAGAKALNSLSNKSH